MDFIVLILGSDINAYYMARCYHEQYNEKAYMIGKLEMNFTSYSKIINLEIYADLQEEISFKRILKHFYMKHRNKKILLIGSNDTYIRLIIENQDYLKRYFIFPYFSIDLLNNLLLKEKFYSNFKDLPKPETFVYNINEILDRTRIKKFGYPLILKPSNGILYHEHDFINQHKVYKVKNFRELTDVISAIKESGYNGNLIIQKYIAGDDSYLFDCVAYLDRYGKVKLMTFAQIALQEHTITGIGNATILVNGYNSFGGTNKIIKKIKSCLEKMNYHGFLEVDLKYDLENKEFKVLEINPRQARSSYYLTFAGFNLIKYLVDDLIYEKKMKYTFVDNEVCLSFVPKIIVKKYVNNCALKEEILKLYREKKVINPLKNKKDNLFKRKMWLRARDINYIKKYKQNSW